MLLACRKSVGSCKAFEPVRYDEDAQPIDAAMGRFPLSC